MTEDERITLVKILAGIGMWGHGWIGPAVCKELQKQLPVTLSWPQLFEQYKEAAEEEAIGVVTDEEEIRSYISMGYHLCNYTPGKLSIHNPWSRGGGLRTYIKGPLAETYGALYDPYNFAVYKRRVEGAKRADSTE